MPDLPPILARLDITREPEPGELSSPESLRWSPDGLTLGATRTPLERVFVHLSRGSRELEGGLFSDARREDVIYAVITAGGERVKLMTPCSADEAEDLPHLEHTATEVDRDALLSLLHTLRVGEASFVYRGADAPSGPQGRVELQDAASFAETYPTLDIIKRDASEALIALTDGAETLTVLCKTKRAVRNGARFGTVVSDRDARILNQHAASLLESPPDPLDRTHATTRLVVHRAGVGTLTIDPADPEYGQEVAQILELGRGLRSPSRFASVELTPTFASRFAWLFLLIGGTIFLAKTELLERTREEDLVRAAMVSVPLALPMLVAWYQGDTRRHAGPGPTRLTFLRHLAIATAIGLGATWFFFVGIFPGL